MASSKSPRSDFRPYLIALSRGTTALRRGAGLSVAHVSAFGGLYPNRPRHRRPGRSQGQARRRAGVSDVGGDVVSGLSSRRIRYRRKRHALGARQAGKSRPPDKFPLNLPPGFPLDSAPEGHSLSQMLADGALDVVMAARRPSCFVARHPKVRGCFRIIARPSATISANRHLPDHARGRRPPRRAGSHPWLAAEHLQGVRAGQAPGRRRIRRNHRAENRPALGQRRISTTRGR